MSLLGLDCTDKIVINGVDLVNQDELSQGQLRELQRFIDENSHILKFMERPLEEPKESRFTKSPTPSRYGTIRSRIGYPADVNDGYQTLSQKFGLPNRDREIDYERTETYHRAPKLGWESLSSGRPSPYSTIDRKGSLRRSVGPSDKRVTIDPNYRSSSVDRPTERAMQNMKTNTTESNQIVHQAYNQGTQSLGRNAPRDSVYSTPFDPSKIVIKKRS
ncbi:unnamed protein product, partial [Mesorhabditis belari]|uniref:Uncharacterized protein n=1 Tax=Mesorhabditis belari TaxID=2138241 RepID=A0AAF3EV59_9BILA